MQREQDEKTSTETAEAIAADKEATRCGSWTNYLLQEAIRRDPTTPLDVGKFTAAIPSSGWPPGVSESDFHFAGSSVSGKEVDDVGETSMGKMLAEMQERRARVRRA